MKFVIDAKQARAIAEDEAAQRLEQERLLEEKSRRLEQEREKARQRAERLAEFHRKRNLWIAALLRSCRAKALKEALGGDGDAKREFFRKYPLCRRDFSPLTKSGFKVSCNPAFDNPLCVDDPEYVAALWLKTSGEAKSELTAAQPAGQPDRCVLTVSWAHWASVSNYVRRTPDDSLFQGALFQWLADPEGQLLVKMISEAVERAARQGDSKIAFLVDEAPDDLGNPDYERDGLVSAISPRSVLYLGGKCLGLSPLSQHMFSELFRTLGFRISTDDRNDVPAGQSTGHTDEQAYICW